ncbi:MAG: TRAP transporter small permease [Desulfobacterium sp.]|jgi:TRAP-type C4-dicarboxylate transport system permease small subunit|nr:TRAP transporter small permease [Desulfobacterium sp.]
MGFSRIIRVLHRLEDFALILLLLTMMITAVLQIVLRNTTGSALMWGDTLVRILVLWVGLVGAMVATRQNRHINIDVVTRHLPPGAARAVNGITLLSASLICLVTAWYSFMFVRMEFEFTTPAFAGVPTWACQTIIPVAFLVMALRCLGFAVRLFTYSRESQP